MLTTYATAALPSGLGSPRPPSETRGALTALLLLIPVFLAFELWQLVIAERYVGIKQIQRGIDPRELGLGEGIAAAWSLLLFAYWAWMVLMLIQPVGRPQVLLMLTVTAGGLMIRRGCGLKWLLVVLTFEGAIRVGMLVSLGAVAWWRLRH